ncbi:MAG: Ger(x)C family spore germination C-terminal domain-containing protein [Oscillospiraceae bacterium]|nr:Ger(x)C family spore germination C-terminal domain-containing protein [Oscillospiraceae bacterium]
MKLKALLITFSILLLMGCDSYTPFVRLEQRIVVQLMGIDYEEGEFTTTMQFSLGKRSDAGVNENDLKVIKGSGINVHSAVRQARAAIGKELLFTQIQVILLGRGVLENNAVETIEDFLTYCDKHSIALVAGTYETAEELIAKKYKDEFADKNKVLLIMENAGNTGVFPSGKIYETLMSAYNVSGACFIPLLGLRESSNKDSVDSTSEGGDNEVAEGNMEIVPAGGALIIDGKMAARLDEYACSGLAMLMNKANTASVTFQSPFDNKPYSIEIHKVKTKIHPFFDGENLVYKADITAYAETAFNRVLLDIRDGKTLPNEYIKKTAEKTVLERLDTAVHNTAGYGGDVLMLEDCLKHYNPGDWLKLEENWRDEVKSAQFVFTVNIEII